MRRRFHFIVALLLISLTLGAAAYARMPGTKQGTVIQNLTGISPTAGASRCDRFASKTKGVMKNYSTANYSGIAYTVTDDAGAVLPAKRRINNGTAGLVGNSGTVAIIDQTSIAFDAISSASPGKNYNICIERQ